MSVKFFADNVDTVEKKRLACRKAKPETLVNLFWQSCLIDYDPLADDNPYDLIRDEIVKRLEAFERISQITFSTIKKGE